MIGLPGEGPPVAPRDFRDPRGGKGVDLGYTDLGRQFVQAARECNARKLQLLLDQDAPVNYKDPSDKMTALHYIAAYRARPALRVLLKSGKCDFLIRDGQGRLPSQLAREFGRDDAMARLLLIKEIRQAQAQNIDLESLHKRSARKPAL
jgi:ankyrin repeat protein